MVANRNENPGAIRELPTDHSKLVVVADYTNTQPESLFEYWTRPELLAQWWPHQANVDARMGGAYHLTWPDMGWSLRGHYLEYDPPRQLAFSWQWDHEPDTPTRQVFVDFEPAEKGTHLRVTQGSYMDTEQDRQEREEHLEGWTHFLIKLRILLEGE